MALCVANLALGFNAAPVANVFTRSSAPVMGVETMCAAAATHSAHEGHGWRRGSA